MRGSGQGNTAPAPESHAFIVVFHCAAEPSTPHRRPPPPPFATPTHRSALVVPCRDHAASGEGLPVPSMRIVHFPALM